MVSHWISDTTFRLRPANERDAGGILACLAAAFEPYRDAYTTGAWRDTVLDAASLRRRMSAMRVLAAESQSPQQKSPGQQSPEGRVTIVGTIAFAAHPPTGHVRGMAVLPGWQGTRLAAALLASAENDLHHLGCTRVTLDTTEPLRRAIHFYTRHGYAASGHVTDFFGMRLYEYAKVLSANCCSGN